MDKKLQDKYIEFQNSVQEIETLQQHIQELQNQRIELENIDHSLSEIKKLSWKNKILVPLGCGLFSHGSIEENDEVVMNVGAGIYLKKNNVEAREIVQNQMEEFDQLIKHFEKDLKNKTTHVNDLQREISKISPD